MDIPFLDDITMTELENLVDEMKHENDLKAENENQIDSNKNGGSGDNSDVTSEVALYDKL